MKEFKQLEEELAQLKILSQQKSCPMIHNCIVRFNSILEELQKSIDKAIDLERKHCGLHMKSHVHDLKLLKLTYPDYPFDVPKEVWDKAKNKN